jgi:hypothetical protein
VKKLVLSTGFLIISSSFRNFSLILSDRKASPGAAAAAIPPVNAVPIK